MGEGTGLYMYDVVVKSSRSLSRCKWLLLDGAPENPVLANQ